MQSSGPWDPWLPVVENSRLFAQHTVPPPPRFCFICGVQPCPQCQTLGITTRSLLDLGSWRRTHNVSPQAGSTKKHGSEAGLKYTVRPADL